MNPFNHNHRNLEEQYLENWAMDQVQPGYSCGLAIVYILAALVLLGVCLFG